MRRVPFLAALVGVAALAPGGPRQAPPGDPLTDAGVARAAAVVDAVFTTRTAARAVVRGGDFGSYLMARVGVVPIPPDLRLRVVVDTTHMELTGRVADLPSRTREALGALLFMVPPTTPIAAEIELSRAAREVIRFHLASARVGGMPVPEPMLHAVLSRMGHQYPGLGETGRDLYVRIPPDGNVELVAGGVRLTRSTVGKGAARQ